MFKIKNTLSTLVASAVVAVAAFAAPSAYASPLFEIDVNQLGLHPMAPANFFADEITGTSAARIVQDTTPGMENIYHAKGYIKYTAFNNGSYTYNAIESGLNGFYLMYATFSQTFTCTGVLSAGSGNCALSDVVLNLYIDKLTDGMNTYTPATETNDPTVIVTPNQIHLGSVSTVYSGFAAVDIGGGAHQQAVTDFSLTADGKKFFVWPDPFYAVGFSAFYNLSTGIACYPNCGNVKVLTINQETGNSTFARSPVPEPGPLALIGLGLLGLVAARRNKKAA